jgi:hypothetical protein
MNPFVQTFDLPPNDQKLFERMNRKTQIVKFGLFNIMNVGHSGFKKQWLGWIDEKDQAFKIFRVASSSSTSDFVLRGRVNFERNLTRIRLSIYPQYTLFLGYGGIGITCYVLAKNTAETYFYSFPWLFGISFITLMGAFTAYKFWDYSKSIQAFEQLIDPKNDELEKRNVRHR